MIGLIFALKEEISSIKKLSSDIKTYQSNFFKYFIFQVNGKEYVATYCGVGKANAAACTADMINSFSVKKILNIGSCGSKDMNVNIFDIVLVNRNYYIDVDATIFGYDYGQIPQEPTCYENNNSFAKAIKNILDKNDVKYFYANCGTSDSFVDVNNYKKINKDLFKKISCIDMEAAAINQIATKSKVECCFIKIISDSLFNDMRSDEEFDKNIKKIGNMTVEILRKILETL